MDGLRATSSVLDFNAQIILNPSSQRPELAFRLRHEPPSVLAVWKNRVHSAEAFISSYREGTAQPQVVELEADSAADFSQELRRALIRMRRLSPALLLLQEIDSAEGNAAKVVDLTLEDPPLPIDSWTSKKKHDRFGHFYEFDKGPLWYSKVVARQDRHGGCYFKLHRRVGETLEWVANLGHDGTPLPTHKGPVGKSIPMSELHG
ncbi:hypothetical protein [Saccharothrix sp. Mg75]|uniref:hypothetical protein n=1 Tax=Saccharothrix sp. Mg75 TaxID=3445357 RepID=UPI003EEC2357